MTLLISPEAQAANENETRRNVRVLFLGAEIYPHDEHRPVEITSCLATVGVLDWPVANPDTSDSSVHQSFYLDNYENSYQEKKRNAITQFGQTAFSIFPTGGPERVQHLIGNNIFCCKQAFGSFWEPEVEQKLTEAAAVCNSPRREAERVRETAVTLRLFLFILSGTFGQKHTIAEQEFGK